MGKMIDLSGMRFGRLTVVDRAENSESNSIRWNCVCDCGNKTVSFSNGLRNGSATSCGCLSRQRFSELGKSKRKHGLSRSKIQDAWLHMKQRCYSKRSDQYKNYGAKGIKVCDRWKESFENFVADMGEPPSRLHTLERIDTRGNYEPENCRWATVKEQQRNRTNNLVIEIDGMRKCLAEWCEETNTGYQKAYARIKKLGWNPRDAIGLR